MSRNAEASRDGEVSQTADGIYVALTFSSLDVVETLSSVRSPQAGANVLFSGTTRDTFADKAVKQLQYTAYASLAIKTMRRICEDIKSKHDLIAIAMVHRLGVVPIGEDSILIAVSAKHRGPSWRAGEEALEACKQHVEVWKLEEFDGEEGVWRANRDGAAGTLIPSIAESSR